MLYKPPPHDIWYLFMSTSNFVFIGQGQVDTSKMSFQEPVLARFYSKSGGRVK